MSAFCLIAGDAHPALGRRVAEITGAALVPIALAAFADGETLVRIEGEVAGADLYIVQPTSSPVNEHLVALALIADAARSAGAARLTAVMPYFGYARQDARKSAGEPRSAQMASRILECAGIDRLVALELHSPALDSAFRIPLVHLDADEAVFPLIREWRLPDLTVVSPDAGGLKRAQRYASALGAPLAVIAKTRPQPDAAVALAVLGDVRGRSCLIVDDLASTGGTIAAGAQALRREAAASVHAFFVHAVMAPTALEIMRAAGVQRIGVTDSVAPVKGTQAGMPAVAEIAPLLARAVARLAGR
jgi:ribose-phosphate pyrophosphokinase